MFVDFRVVDDAGQVLPHDGRAQGELQVRGLHVVREYFRVGHPNGIHNLFAVTTTHAFFGQIFIGMASKLVNAWDFVCANLREYLPASCMSALSELMLNKLSCASYFLL